MAVGEDDTVASTLPGPGVGRTDVAELVAERYRIIRWLGGGGMGRVYEALDTELNERVALKVLRAGLSEDAIERFRREVRLTRRVQHRNVARMFDIGDHGGDKFLTMELIDGEPLTQALAVRMPWPRLHALALQLCEGLAAAHRAGIVHRDLKPDNVLIERTTERAVITDFGIARSIDDAAVTQAGAVIGTPRYMAPEQLQGQSVDARADLFSLGVMLYELASCTRPWSGNNAIEMAVAQATQPARPLVARHVPTRFIALVESCLALEPAGRPASAADIAAALATVGVAGIESDQPRETIPPAFSPTPTPLPTIAVDTTTLAVLQFATGPDDDHLADAIREDLTDTLSTGSVRVRPAHTAMCTNADPRELGRTLGVDHVVAGSVRRSPAGLRIAARLISVADGFQIWANRIDCDQRDLFAVCEQLGHGLASALSTRAKATARPTDPRAVDLYLRARAELRRFWGNHVLAASELLEEAVALAPESPAILSALALARTTAWVRAGRPELLGPARHAVDRALSTGHAEALLGAALLRANLGDPVGAASDLGRALARAQMSAPAHETAARLLLEVGEIEEALHHFDLAIGLDPGRAQLIAIDLARLDALNGQWDAASARIATLSSDPDPSIAQAGAMIETRIATWRADVASAIAAVGRLRARLGPSGGGLLEVVHAWASGKPFDPVGWEHLITEIETRDQPRRMQILSLQRAAEIALLMGELEAANRPIRRASELGLIDLVWLDRCALLAPLRADARWKPLRDEVADRAERVLAAFRSAST